MDWEKLFKNMFTCTCIFVNWECTIYKNLNIMKKVNIFVPYFRK